MRRASLVIPILALSDLLSSILTFVAPVLGTALCVFAVASLADALAIRPWVLLSLGPVLYMAWLTVFLATSALEMRLLGLVFRKPERRLEPMDGLRSALASAALTYIYRRGIFVHSVPMINVMLYPPLLLQFLRNLTMRAYAPAVHIGRNPHVFVWLQDPDLTYIGDDVVIGSGTEIVCHAFNRLPDGGSVYQAARVAIGSRVVVGGNCRIGMGVSIGENAMVESGSNVTPYSRIEPGEVWGGNPAAFLRKRDGAAPVPAGAPAGLDVDDRTAVKAIVAKALDRRPEDVPADLRADGSMAWDSMAKMAIAATLHDRLGIRVPAASVVALDSVSAIESLVAAHRRGKSPASSRAEPDPHPDPELLPLSDPQAVTRTLARRFEGVERGETRRIVVAATFTAQPVAGSLELWCRAFGVPVAVAFEDFNQVEQALLSPGSSFHGNESGLNVVLVRPEDLIGERDPDGMARARQLLAAVDGFRSKGGALAVSALPPTVSPFFSGDDTAVERLRLWWGEEIRRRDGVQLLDFPHVVEEVGRENARDVSSEVIARAPYSPILFQRLGMAIARLVRARFLPPKKVLAVDCDGILWGGVVGEDGIDGIELGDDHPGRGFGLLQRRLLDLKNRGVLLALVSKNEEADVWAVFEAHPGMVLRRSDVAAARINWRAKSTNLRELAEELSLGLDSFVFLDDSPVEREEVKRNAPEVTVVPVPEDPALFAETLGRLWCFDGAGVTAEDGMRTRLVSEEARRRKLREEAGGLEAFLESLEVVADVHPVREPEMARVAQLTQKTNQFNLSLIRRSPEEIRGLASARTILALNARDRLGDYGLVGVAIFGLVKEHLLLDTFLMSCRVLGRGVEDAFLCALFDLARQSNCTAIVAPFREGPRNQQTRTFFLKAGFAGSDGTLSMAVARAPLPPTHLRLHLHFDGLALEAH